MEKRFTQAQLAEIVAEVERLAQQRIDQLDQEEVKLILLESDLPADLVEEAIRQLTRRDALAAHRQRDRTIILAILTAVIIVGAGFWGVRHQHQQALQRITVQQDRITRTEEDGGTLTGVDRQPPTELVYRVTLAQAPVGETLSLSCDWLDAQGQIVQQNRYQTRKIETAIWQTRCRHTIGTSASPGTWTVRMFLEDRLISDIHFEVR
jgi:hypothetical protein